MDPGIPKRDLKLERVQPRLSVCPEAPGFRGETGNTGSMGISRGIWKNLLIDQLRSLVSIAANSEYRKLGTLKLSEYL